jgi:hypothetical protein
LEPHRHASVAAITDGFHSGGTQTCNFGTSGNMGYDDLNRLVYDDCGSGNWGQTFSYDQYNNLTKSIISGRTGTTFNPGYNSSNNQYSSGYGATYDSNGNQPYDPSNLNTVVGIGGMRRRTRLAYILGQEQRFTLGPSPLAQELTHYLVGAQPFARIRYGDESDDWHADAIPCHDCAVVKAQYHVPSCDVEECPNCQGQALSCDCELSPYPAKERI